MNAYLKEIVDVCEINKNLPFHIARHTFATTVTLSNGVPIETVSKNAWAWFPQTNPALCQNFGQRGCADVEGEVGTFI